jgi:hypothetical protein
MDDVFAAFEFRGLIVLLTVDSASALRFGGMLGDNGYKCYCNLVNWKGKDRIRREEIDVRGGRTLFTTYVIYLRVEGSRRRRDYRAR